MTREPDSRQPAAEASEWVDLYGDSLYRFAVLRVRDPDIAADLVQDTLLAALQARQGFESRAAVKTWLTAILKNKIIDHLRRACRTVPLSLEPTPDRDTEDYFDESGRWKVELTEWNTPDQATEREQFLRTLMSCLARLPQRMAQLFLLRELDGMSVEELCKQLELSSTNNVWVSLSRTRMRLRNCLDENWFGR
jgi:RNA polymerase sigma-70 factor (ECF subfamily)